MFSYWPQLHLSLHCHQTETPFSPEQLVDSHKGPEHLFFLPDNTPGKSQGRKGNHPLFNWNFQIIILLASKSLDFDYILHIWIWVLKYA